LFLVSGFVVFEMDDITADVLNSEKLQDNVAELLKDAYKAHIEELIGEFLY